MEDKNLSGPMEGSMASDQQWGVSQSLQPYPPQYCQSDNNVDPRLRTYGNEQQYYPLSNGNEFGTSYPDVPDQNTQSESYPVFNGWNGMNEQFLAQKPVFEQNRFPEPQSSEENAKGRLRNISPSVHPSGNIHPNFEDMDPEELKQREAIWMATLEPDALALMLQAPIGPTGLSTDFPITVNNFNTNNSYNTIEDQGQWNPAYFGINTQNSQNGDINFGVLRDGLGANAMTAASQSPGYYPGMADTIQRGSEINKIVENSQYPQHTMGLHHARNNTQNDRAFPATRGDLNIAQDERIYMPTPDIFGGQKLHHAGFTNINRVPAPSPEFQSTFQGFTNDDLAPPPNGFYDTTLTRKMRTTTNSVNPENLNPDAQNASIGDAIPAPKRAKGGASAKKERRSRMGRDESHYPVVWMTEPEMKAIDPNYEKNPRRAFQDMGNAKRGCNKGFQIDWDQVELLNAHRQNARHDEQEREKLCGPGQYVPKFINPDYKPKARLQEHQNAWREAKKEGVISDDWTNRIRRTANRKHYKPAEEAGN
ncbi:hypothetical protein EAF04_001106 [Stromatinia cepivora]|nr:hypothetical protein EAF04_001106 [Stromatinia cepivora]